MSAETILRWTLYIMQTMVYGLHVSISMSAETIMDTVYHANHVYDYMYQFLCKPWCLQKPIMQTMVYDYMYQFLCKPCLQKPYYGGHCISCKPCL